MYLFKSSIIQNKKLYFDTGLVLYEDFNFNLKYLEECKNILLIPDVLYHYNLFTSINQLEKRKKSNIVSDINTISRTLINFLNSFGGNENIVKQMFPYITTMYNLCFKKIILNRKTTKYEDKKEVLKLLRSDDIYNRIMKEYGYSLRF